MGWATDRAREIVAPYRKGHQMDNGNPEIGRPPTIVVMSGLDELEAAIVAALEEALKNVGILRDGIDRVKRARDEAYQKGFDSGGAIASDLYSDRLKKVTQERDEAYAQIRKLTMPYDYDPSKIRA